MHTRRHTRNASKNAPPATTRDVQQPKRNALLGVYLVLLGVAYYFAARLGLGFRFQNTQIGVVWPANGLLLAALLLTSRRHWWLVFLTTGLAHAIVMQAAVPDVPAWRWAWQIAGNAVFTVTTAQLISRYAGMPLHFGNRRQVMTYTFFSFAMPLLYGFTTPSFVRSLFGFESTFHPAAALLRTLLSNLTGLLLVAPILILGVQYGVRRSKELPAQRLFEAAVMMSTLLAVGAVAFFTGPEIARFPSLLLWIVPPLLWAAVRFGPMGATASVFCIAALSIWGTARQLGPFVHFVHTDQVLSLQLFWVVLSVPVMLLAAVIRERENMELTLSNLRSQLAHVSRTATVGELSGALAHELRQPLTSILANAQAGIYYLSARVPNLAELRAILDDIVEQDRHAASVITGLQSFLKKSDAAQHVVTLDSLVRDALSLSRGTIRRSMVEVQALFNSEAERVRGDPLQLLQVLLNLIVNACEAMREKPSYDRHLRVQVMLGTREWLHVLIADSGPGLPKGAEYEVFEPFFTTKEKGLGLGLAIARSIARAHGGHLWGETNAQGGATFHLELPAETARASASPSIPPASDVSAQSRIISKKPVAAT